VTELQYGLIGLGVATLAGVVGYNKWQEYRHRKVAEAVLAPHHDDVLLNIPTKSAPVVVPDDGETAFAYSEVPGERIEPVFVRTEPVAGTAYSAPAPMAETEPVFVATPVVEEAPPPKISPVVEPFVQPIAAQAPVGAYALPDESTEAPVSVPIADVPAELLDPRLEFIVAMELIEPVPARQILQSQREVLHKMSKPVHWVAFNERKREWERLHLDSELPVRRLRIGLQLVNRLGPVSGSDLAIFSGAMQALADELMAVADMPPSRVLDQAAEIDASVLRSTSKSASIWSAGVRHFPAPRFAPWPKRPGWSLAWMVCSPVTTTMDGRSSACRITKMRPFSADNLRNLSTHGLTFLLDVPRVDHGERVFQQMTELAKRFGETLQGTLVDDNRQPLRESQLEHIRREFIGKPQATMQTFGLPAGSPQALRLFS
jgi:hypothetical protein